jgi:hypothetical protein
VLHPEYISDVAMGSDEVLMEPFSGVDRPPEQRTSDRDKSTHFVAHCAVGDNLSNNAGPP